MIRIFTFLATFAVLFIAATLLLGFALRTVDIRDAADATARNWATVHRLSGVAAGLAVLLVNSIVVTYFIGTSRWCREVSETYRLHEQFTARSTRLKRRAFPLSVLSMLIAVGIVALGGAADPGADVLPLAQRTGVEAVTWSTLHSLGAMLGLALIAFFFVQQASYILANHRVITDVLGEVRRIRLEHGLDVEEQQVEP